MLVSVINRLRSPRGAPSPRRPGSCGRRQRGPAEVRGQPGVDGRLQCVDEGGLLGRVLGRRHARQGEEPLGESQDAAHHQGRLNNQTKDLETFDLISFPRMKLKNNFECKFAL